MSKQKARLIIMLTLAILVSAIKLYNVPQNIQAKQVVAVTTDMNVVKNAGTLVTVSRVVDGDTIKVMIGDKEDTVRLIGINTPESVDPRTIVECFGKEASEKMKELVEGKNIYLVKDETQSPKDKYSRLLAYVYLEDGTFINQKMITDGYAFEYTYNIPYKYQSDFKSLENNARIGELGLWNKSACNYKENPKKPGSKKGRRK